MRYYLETDSYIKDKVKVVLNLSNYATKNELDHDTGVSAPDLSATKDFITLKAELGKLDINTLVKVPISLNNSKTKADDFEVILVMDIASTEMTNTIATNVTKFLIVKR